MNKTEQEAPAIIDTGQQSLDVEWVEIDRLKPYDRNAKAHSEEQIINVAKSIDKYGWKQPIVVDADFIIVIGHCRYLAAKHLELDRVPVVVAHDLTKEQAAELRIIDNKSNESPWDKGMLAVELPSIDLSLSTSPLTLTLLLSRSRNLTRNTSMISLSEGRRSMTSRKCLRSGSHSRARKSSRRP